MDFAETCQAYFPRWKAATAWTLQHGSRTHWIDAQGEVQHSTENGYCDITNRIIYVADTTQLTLIHEICHAVTGPWHGTRFCTRLRTAGKRAEQLGEIVLASALADEAEKYAAYVGVRHTLTYIYNSVEDIVCGVPDLTFEEVVDGVSRNFGYTPTELLQRARRLRRVYDEAQAYHAQQ